MVMLDLAVRKFPAEELVVATFDHGTRESSREDAEFVARIAYALQLKFYRGEARLGMKISEEKAREKRYECLRKVAFLEKGEIWTAHHLDDLVETVAINCLRGTGWRGLAVLSAPGVRRPLIEGVFGEVFDKRGILRYAAEREISFRQDPTNASEQYLRNRVRERSRGVSAETKREVYELWVRQVEIKREVEAILEAVLPEDLRFRREWFEGVGEREAMEILRAGLVRAGVSATWPQIREFYRAILNYESGKKFNLPGGRLVELKRRDFQLKVW